MISTFLLQIILPLGLLVYLAFAPVKSLFAYILQIMSTGLVLLALSLVALWMLLPWWLPYVYGLIYLIVISFRCIRLKSKSIWPTTSLSWFPVIILFILGGYSAYLLREAILGRELPDVEIANIQSPFGPGIYLVAHGGSRELINGHMMTLDTSVERFKKYLGQSYGIDIFKVNSLGFRAIGIQPSDPSKYEIFGQPVLAPCDGTVISSRNDRPDMPVPIMDVDVIEGNNVLLNCGNFELLLAHFQMGSVLVKAGDQLIVGDELGTVGNSGKTTEPHLHISAQKSAINSSLLSGKPMAIQINGHFYVRNDRL